MRAHVLDELNTIINTIIVSSLDGRSDLVDAALGGTIGDRYVDGEIIAGQKPIAPSFIDLRAAYFAEVRVMRERVLVRLNGHGAMLLLREPPEFADEKQNVVDLVQGLLDITIAPAVAAAEDMTQLRRAVKNEYARLVGMASPNVVKAFREVDV